MDHLINARSAACHLLPNRRATISAWGTTRQCRGTSGSHHSPRGRIGSLAMGTTTRPQNLGDTVVACQLQDLVPLSQKALVLVIIAGPVGALGLLPSPRRPGGAFLS